MKRILLVEPDREVAEVLVGALNSSEAQAVWANNAQSAIDASDKKTPDLVIVELAVSDQNGLAFLYEFRSYAEWQNVPIIVHSIIPIRVPIDDKIWQNLGVEQYLYKPGTSLKKLKRVVSDYL